VSSFIQKLKWVACCLLAVAWLPSWAQAKAWAPDHTVQFIVPSGAGAALDTAARELQHLLSKYKLLKESFLVINRPGAANTLALQALRPHEGDGNWLATFTTGMINTRVLQPNIDVSYDEMTPIVLLLQESIVVAVRADSPIKSAQDLVAHLKKAPNSLSIAVATSIGNHIHVAIAKPLKAAGVDISKLLIVPYKSSAESMSALLGGHVDVVSASTPNVLAQYKAGKIRLLAVASAHRLSGELANVPTWKEQGVNASFNSVQGVLGPRNMTPQQVEYWENAFAKIAATKEWNDFLKLQLWTPHFVRHAAMKKELAADYVSTKELLGDMKLKSQ